HPYSMQELIPPYLIRLKTNDTCDNGIYTFRFTPGHITQARKILTDELEARFPNDPFEPRLFTDDFRRDGNFRTWIAISNTFLFFTVLIILLAIIGIYGLVSFTTSRRTKEIGIRKVHGSPLFIIYLKIIKDFVILLAIAILVAWPGAYILYQYIPGSYKYGLKLSEFVIATLLILIITLLTTSYQIIKVMLTNPVEALRYE
ncbi:MAG TPA: FtsX-like permease family protein, partial [Bacteroidales bacterium]